MVKFIAAWSIRHRFFVFGFMLIITLFFVWQISKIKIKTEFSDLLPKSHPFIQTHNNYKDQLDPPLKVFMTLQVKEGDIYNKVTLQKVIDITDKLDLIPGVNHTQIYSIASRKLKKVIITEDSVITEDLIKGLPTSMKEFRNDVHKSPGVYGIWVSRDEKSVLFTAGFIESKINYNLILKEVNKIADDESDKNHEIHISGEPILTGLIYAFQKEVWLIFAFTFLILEIVLVLYFRNLVGVVVANISAITGAIWGLGFCSLLGYDLDPLILVIPLLIVARSLSHSIQFTGRYFECYQETKNVKEASLLALSSMLSPGMLGIATDAAGIILIGIAPIPLMQKLALVCGFWAFIIIFTGLILTPVILTFCPPPRNISRALNTETGVFNWLFLQIAKLGFGRPGKVTFGTMIVLFIVTGWISTKVHIGDINPGTPLLWEDDPYNVAVEKLNTGFPGSDELFILVEGDTPQSIQRPEFLNFLQGFQDYMEKTSLAPLTFSVADIFPSTQRGIYGGNPKWEAMPLQREQAAQGFYSLSARSAPGDFDRYFSRDGKTANVIIWYRNHTGDTIRRAIADVKSFIHQKQEQLEHDKINFRLASGNIGLLAAVNEAVEGSQLLNFTLVMGVVFILCSLVYRSFFAALILMIPLNLANFITLSVMEILGIGLNVNTLPIVSVGVGVGIDYGIYLLSRIHEEYQFSGKNEYTFAIAHKAIMTTGRAIFFTALMMILGVIVWYFLSSLRFQAEMGLLLSVIMFVNMLGAMLLIPTLLYVFHPGFLKKEIIQNR